jgi:exo-beta-1,3-glucanase (GH17 family)
MSLADGFTDEDQAALDKFRRMADEAQQPEEAQRLRRVQCGDCGAVGPVVTGEDGWPTSTRTARSVTSRRPRAQACTSSAAGHTTAP